jgi:hypothetical protein
MDQTIRNGTRRVSHPEEPPPSAEATEPDEIEPLDDETLAKIMSADRNADPILRDMVRAAMALAREEERQEEEDRRARRGRGSDSPRSETPAARSDIAE